MRVGWPRASRLRFLTSFVKVVGCGRAKALRKSRVSVITEVSVFFSVKVITLGFLVVVLFLVLVLFLVIV